MLVGVSVGVIVGVTVLVGVGVGVVDVCVGVGVGVGQVPCTEEVISITLRPGPIQLYMPLVSG